MFRGFVPELKDQTADVAITYGWNRVAYNVVRSLSAQGLRVAAGDASRLQMAGKSRYCHSRFSYPSFHRSPRDFVAALKNSFSQIEPAVYLPMHEEIFIVSKHIDELTASGVKIPVHDFETLRTAHRKDLLAQFAERLGIPVPKTYRPKELSDLEMIWDQIGGQGKVVVKQLNTNSSKGVFYADSYESLTRIYSDITRPGEGSLADGAIIQEYVEGDGYGVSMLFNHGEPRARFTHRRLREKTYTGGTSTKRESVTNPLLEGYAETLLRSMRWHGVAMVEFKYDERRKKGWLIEVNPRFWGSLALAIKAGVDFPYLLYKMAVDGDVEPAMTYKTGTVVRWLLGDVLATFSAMKARKSLKPVSEFFYFGNESFDDLYKDDLLPFFTECAYYLSKLVRSRRLNPTDDALLDIDAI